MLFRKKLTDFEEKNQVSSVNDIKIWENSEMKWQISQSVLSYNSAVGVISYESDSSSHDSDSSGWVVKSGHCEHFRYHFDAFSFLSE